MIVRRTQRMLLQLARDIEDGQLDNLMSLTGEPQAVVEKYRYNAIGYFICLIRKTRTLSEFRDSIKEAFRKSGLETLRNIVEAHERECREDDLQAQPLGERLMSCTDQQQIRDFAQTAYKVGEHMSNKHLAIMIAVSNINESEKTGIVRFTELCNKLKQCGCISETNVEYLMDLLSELRLEQPKRILEEYENNIPPPPSNIPPPPSNHRRHSLQRQGNVEWPGPSRNSGSMTSSRSFPEYCSTGSSSSNYVTPRGSVTSGSSGYATPPQGDASPQYSANQYRKSVSVPSSGRLSVSRLRSELQIPHDNTYPGGYSVLQTVATPSQTVEQRPQATVSSQMFGQHPTAHCVSSSMAVQHPAPPTLSQTFVQHPTAPPISSPVAAQHPAPPTLSQTFGQHSSAPQISSPMTDQHSQVPPTSSLTFGQHPSVPPTTPTTATHHHPIAPPPTVGQPHQIPPTLSSPSSHNNITPSAPPEHHLAPSTPLREHIAQPTPPTSDTQVIRGRPANINSRRIAVSVHRAIPPHVSGASPQAGSPTNSSSSGGPSPQSSCRSSLNSYRSNELHFGAPVGVSGQHYPPGMNNSEASIGNRPEASNGEENSSASASSGFCVEPTQRVNTGNHIVVSPPLPRSQTSRLPHGNTAIHARHSRLLTPSSSINGAEFHSSLGSSSLRSSVVAGYPSGNLSGITMSELGNPVGQPNSYSDTNSGLLPLGQEPMPLPRASNLLNGTSRKRSTPPLNENVVGWKKIKTEDYVTPGNNVVPESDDEMFSTPPTSPKTKN